MRVNRSALTVVALAALSVGTTAVLATPASAAAKITPQMVCGKSYSTVNSAPVGSHGSLGTVYLTYNSANGKNCVATIRTRPGTAVSMSAWIYVGDTDKSAQDYGQYTSYAGPVYVHGKAHCVDWGGNIANVYVQVSGSNCAGVTEHRMSSTR
ncbi:spore-associated protein [Streptomyces sp. L2]|uniref:spore-associated protein n=1 Tax=Streptomyces sp. L2 TaxID=2162665 RepID=UPI001010EED8|nr:spore-associated protein [Streptomyces sp. L2]